MNAWGMTASLVDTALHEAGHVVFAVAGGMRISYATIRPDRDSAGHVRTRSADSWGLWNRVVMRVAGCAAVAQGGTHRARLDHGMSLLREQVGGDLTYAARASADWLRQRDMPAEMAYDVIVSALGVAIGMLQRRHWRAALTRVAGALLTSGTISGRRCVTLGTVQVLSPEAQARDAIEHALGVR